MLQNTTTNKNQHPPEKPSTGPQPIVPQVRFKFQLQHSPTLSVTKRSLDFRHQKQIYTRSETRTSEQSHTTSAKNESAIIRNSCSLEKQTHLMKVMISQVTEFSGITAADPKHKCYLLLYCYIALKKSNFALSWAFLLPCSIVKFLKDERQPCNQILYVL